jgi:hypothetical protein
MLFLGFGLFARFNLTVMVSLLIGALSIAAAIFLILGLNHTFSSLLRSIPPPKAALRHEPGAFDLNDACKSAAEIRGSQSDGDHYRC